MDTNILDKQFILNPEVEELMRFKNITTGEIEIVLLEIVQQELVDHARRIINKNNENIRALNRLRQWDSLSPVKELDPNSFALKYKKQLNERFEVFVPTKDVYERVFNRYFKELKPFENKKQEFKDGLLWETIIDFKNQVDNGPNRFVFITKNSTDFSIDKQNKNKNNLHSHYKTEFPNLVLKNDISGFLKEEGYYSEFKVDDSIEEQVLSLLEDYFKDHRWEFEETLSEYIFNKNTTSKKEFILNNFGVKHISLNLSEKILKSDKYIHIPILIQVTIGLMVRSYNDPWEINENEEYESINIPSEIKCDAVFTAENGNYDVVIMDKIKVQDE